MENNSIQTILTIIPIIISVLSLVGTIFIGLKQANIYKKQFEFQSKTEIYLFVNTNNNSIWNQHMCISNIGNNVIYLDRFIINGMEYDLNMEILPVFSSTNVVKPIPLPMNGNNHVSLNIYFNDWQGNKWLTKGEANFQNGQWGISYKPCELVKN